MLLLSCKRKCPFWSKTYCERENVPLPLLFPTVRCLCSCPWRVTAAARSTALGGWLLPLILLHLAAGCCPSFHFAWWLAAAPRSATLSSWLLPLIPLHLVAGCCPSFRCTWRLVAAPCSAAFGGWLLPLVPLHLAAGCCPSFCCTWRLAAAPRSAARHTVPTDVLGVQPPHMSETIYVCWIPSPAKFFQ